MMKEIDILAIGDVVTDAFIRLQEATVNCEINNTDCKLCMKFGQKIPYEFAEITKAVGNSANAAVSAARLGLNSALFAYVGDDTNGKECIETLEGNGVITNFVHTEAGKHTNYHYVLWYDVERTILIKHETFTYKLGDIGKPKWIYLSSLAEHTLPFHQEIAEFIKHNSETKLVFQPGTFQIRMGKEALADIYKHTEVFFCNVEEAQQILSVTSRDVKSLLKMIAALGPKKVFITDGIEGAYAFDGTDFWFMPVYPHKPYERTGAGDAFASTVISALVLGKTLDQALTWGPINSMSVVQQIGAQKGLISREQIEDFLSKAPEGYKAERI